MQSNDSISVTKRLQTGRMLRPPITSRKRSIVLLWGLARNARKRLMCEAIAAGPGFPLGQPLVFELDGAASTATLPLVGRVASEASGVGSFLKF